MKYFSRIVSILDSGYSFLNVTDQKRELFRNGNTAGKENIIRQALVHKERIICIAKRENSGYSKLKTILLPRS